MTFELSQYRSTVHLKHLPQCMYCNIEHYTHTHITLTTPSSVPAANNFPSCLKHAEKAASLNREIVFLTWLLEPLYTCTYCV